MAKFKMPGPDLTLVIRFLIRMPIGAYVYILWRYLELSKITINVY